MAVYESGKLEGAQIPDVGKGSVINQGEFIVQSINPETITVRHETGREVEWKHSLVEKMLA